ncbi:MAG: hypothetical protein AAF664_18870 [Planctomycetota bacterium]
MRVEPSFTSIGIAQSLSEYLSADWALAEVPSETGRSRVSAEFRC